MQDISLGVAMGSATQISMFVVRMRYYCNIVLTLFYIIKVIHIYIFNKTIFSYNFQWWLKINNNKFQVPLSVVVAWIMGIRMDLDFNLLETGCLAFAVIVTAFTLQVCTMPSYIYIHATFPFFLY